MQIGARERSAHRPLDELAERRINALAVRAADVELNLLDRRNGLGDSVVGGLRGRKVDRKQSAAIDVAEKQLAAQRFDAAAIRVHTRDRNTFIMVVDSDGIRELVALA